MSTETADDAADGLDSHVRSLLVVATTTLGGVAAAAASFELAPDSIDGTGLIVLATALAVELGIMQAAGIDVREFSTKDQLYVLFMTFSMWFIALTILLTTAPG